MIRSSKQEYINTGMAAKEFLNVNFKEKFKVFQKYIAAASDAKTMLSERTQDPDWFEGTNNNLTIIISFIFFLPCHNRQSVHSDEMLHFQLTAQFF